jgi:hypothetical protein
MRMIPVLGEFKFQVGYRTDVYAEQRGLEDVLCGTARVTGLLCL